MTKTCVDTFLEAQKGRIKASTFTQYERVLGLLMTFAADRGKMFIQQLDANLLSDFKIHGLDMAETSKTTAVKKVRGFLRWCWEERDWLVIDLARKMSGHPSAGEQKMPYTPAEMACILQTARELKDTSKYGANGPLFALLLELMVVTGLRCGDAVRFFAAKCKKSTSKTSTLWKYSLIPQKTVKTPKSNRNPVKTVYLTDDLKQRIDACKSDWMSPDRPFAHSVVDLSNEANDRTSGMSQEVYSRMQVIGKKCGIEDCRPHRLRDTFAVECLKNGMAIGDVSQLMGHSSVTITENFYRPWIEDLEILLEERLAASLAKR